MSSPDVSIRRQQRLQSLSAKRRKRQTRFKTRYEDECDQTEDFSNLNASTATSDPEQRYSDVGKFTNDFADLSKRRINFGTLEEVSDDEEINDSHLAHAVLDFKMEHNRALESDHTGLGIASSLCSGEMDMYARFLICSVFYQSAPAFLRAANCTVDAIAFRRACTAIERPLMSRIESLVVSREWKPIFLHDLHTRLQLQWEHCSMPGICSICHRSHSSVSCRMTFSGIRYDSRALWGTSNSRPFGLQVRSNDLSSFHTTDEKHAISINDCIPASSGKRDHHRQPPADSPRAAKASGNSSDSDAFDPSFRTKKRQRLEKRNSCADVVVNKQTPPRVAVGHDGALQLETSDSEDAWSFSSEDEPESVNYAGQDNNLNTEARTEDEILANIVAHNIQWNQSGWEQHLPRVTTNWVPNANECHDAQQDSLEEERCYFAGRFCKNRARLYHAILHFKLRLILDGLRCIRTAIIEQEVSVNPNEIIWHDLILYTIDRHFTSHQLPPAPPLAILKAFFECDGWKLLVKRWSQFHCELCEVAEEFAERNRKNFYSGARDVDVIDRFEQDVLLGEFSIPEYETLSPYQLIHLCRSARSPYTSKQRNRAIYWLHNHDNNDQHRDVRARAPHRSKYLVSQTSQSRSVAPHPIVLSSSCSSETSSGSDTDDNIVTQTKRSGRLQYLTVPSQIKTTSCDLKTETHEIANVYMDTKNQRDRLRPLDKSSRDACVSDLRPQLHNSFPHGATCEQSRHRIAANVKFITSEASKNGGHRENDEKDSMIVPKRSAPSVSADDRDTAPIFTDKNEREQPIYNAEFENPDHDKVNKLGVSKKSTGASRSQPVRVLRGLPVCSLRSLRPSMH